MRASYDEWLEAVKARCVEQGLDYRDLADVYLFRQAYEEFDMKPNEAVAEAAAEVEARRND